MSILELLVLCIANFVDHTSDPQQQQKKKKKSSHHLIKHLLIGDHTASNICMWNDLVECLRTQTLLHCSHWM